MPTIEELQDAINQLSEMPVSFDTCLKLSTYYNLMNILSGEDKKALFGANMTYTSDTDFMKLASKTDINDLMAVIDELFSCIQLTAPKLYDSAIYKLKKANL